MADVYEMYHGTVAGLVESIIQTGLRPSKDGPTLVSDLHVAWHFACSRSETDPVVLAYLVPGGQFNDYCHPPLPARTTTAYALKQNLPGDWVRETISKSDPRVAL